LRSFLISQSLNQIEKAYGPNNSILDNCHVRVAFATNDERTAKRLSDAIGSTTEMRAMRNYAGHRLAPWLSHVMVSRQETARQLITPGEIMQLPQEDELILVSGFAPIRAKKLTYYTDKNFTGRVLSPPTLSPNSGDYPDHTLCDWGQQTRSVDDRLYTEAEKKAAVKATQKQAVEDDGGNERKPDIDISDYDVEETKDVKRDFAEDEGETLTPSVNIPDFVRQSNPVVQAHNLTHSVEPGLEI